MPSLIELLDELESLENSPDYNLAKIATPIKKIAESLSKMKDPKQIFEFIVEGVLRDVIEAQQHILDLQDNGFRNPKYFARVIRIHDYATFTPYIREGNNRAETLLRVYIDVAKDEYDSYLRYYALGKYHGVRDVRS